MEKNDWKARRYSEDLDDKNQKPPPTSPVDFSSRRHKKKLEEKANDETGQDNKS